MISEAKASHVQAYTIARNGIFAGNDSQTWIRILWSTKHPVPLRPAAEYGIVYHLPKAPYLVQRRPSSSASVAPSSIYCSSHRCAKYHVNLTARMGGHEFSNDQSHLRTPDWWRYSHPSTHPPNNRYKAILFQHHRSFSWRIELPVFYQIRQSSIIAARRMHVIIQLSFMSMGNFSFSSFILYDYLPQLCYWCI